jgi:putative aldouronate transport system permease protein
MKSLQRTTKYDLKTNSSSGNGVAALVIPHKASIFQQIWKYRALMLMFLPGFAFILLFNYGPLYGIQIAFKDYRISDGIWGSKWVGLKHFISFFTTPNTLNVLKNTIVISLYKLAVGFPAPIILAIMINEVGGKAFKRVSQTISYLPHFISWVIVAGMITKVLSPSSGVVNDLIKAFGGKPIYFLAVPEWFPTILVITNVWKEIGWSSVVYLAALTSVDPQLYEAALIDGASRIQRIWRISIPSILSVVTVILILSMGGILNAGFDQIFNMYNPSVYSVADIIDTFVYRVGLVQMQYSFSTAVGVFKSVVGLLLMISVNTISSRLTSADYGLFA